MNTAIESNEEPQPPGLDLFCGKLTLMVGNIADLMLEAAEYLAYGIDRLGFDEAQIAERTGLGRGMVSRMLMAARGVVIPELVIGGGAYFPYLRLLPVPQQRLVWQSGVDLLTVEGGTLRAHPKDMTREQLRQVFYNGTVRSLAAQRVWQEALKLEAVSQPAARPKTEEVALPESTRFNRWLKGKEAEMGRKADRMERACFEMAWTAALGGI